MSSPHTSGTLSVSPPNPTANGAVTFSGSGYNPKDAIQLTVDTPSGPTYRDVSLDADGSFSVQVTLGGAGPYTAWTAVKRHDPGKEVIIASLDFQVA